MKGDEWKGLKGKGRERGRRDRWRNGGEVEVLVAGEGKRQGNERV